MHESPNTRPLTRRGPARTPSHARTFGAVGLALVLVAGCAKAPAEEAWVTQIHERVLEDEGLIVQEVDLDLDGQPEVFNYYRERAGAPRLLVRKEMDLNHDGKIDVVSHFGPQGELQKEEMDSDFDGLFDHVDHYQDGHRVMSAYDTSHTGQPNVYKYYVRDADGIPRLDRKERDTNDDGKIDVWERFNSEGEVVRTGRDTTGDGKMDVREE